MARKKVLNETLLETRNLESQKEKMSVIFSENNVMNLEIDTITKACVIELTQGDAVFRLSGTLESVVDE